MITKRHLLFAVVTAVLLATSTPHAQAAFTDNFDSMLAELQDRSLALSNSTDKIGQKQFKAINKVIAAINKPATSLATDLKTAVKVTKTLVKAFPTEFLASTAAATTLSFSNSLSDILITVFDDFKSDVADSLDQLITTVNNLPASSDKDKALAAIAQAQVALAQADSAPDFNSFVKALSSALKAIAKGQKAAASAGGGGGGGTCGTITQSSVTMTASNDAFNASAFAGAEYTQSTKTFSVGGTDGITGNSVAFTVDSGVTGPGTYTINISGNYSVGSPPTQTFNITGGSMTINGLDLAGMTACGTGSFTVTDGVNTINVSDFVFAIKNLGVSP